MDFYPPGVPVPQELRTSRLWLRPLRATDVALDYEAVMSSAEMLHRWSQGDWPARDFTIEQNLADLEWHELQHIGREAFTFTVLDPQGTRCLGCVYIQPLLPVQFPLCKGAAFAADVGFWVRASELENDLDRHLLETIFDWFQAEWAFDCILFTICQQETRQAALFAAAGLERLSACTLPDGRQCWVYGKPLRAGGFRGAPPKRHLHRTHTCPGGRCQGVQVSGGGKPHTIPVFFRDSATPAT